jgi:hypothetical protein
VGGGRNFLSDLSVFLAFFAILIPECRVCLNKVVAS